MQASARWRSIYGEICTSQENCYGTRVRPKKVISLPSLTARRPLRLYALNAALYVVFLVFVPARQNSSFVCSLHCSRKITPLCSSWILLSRTSANNIFLFLLSVSLEFQLLLGKYTSSWSIHDTCNIQKLVWRWIEIEGTVVPSLLIMGSKAFFSLKICFLGFHLWVYGKNVWILILNSSLMFYFDQKLYSFYEVHHNGVMPCE